VQKRECAKVGLVIMKIKVAVLEKDPVYLERFVSSFSSKYADKIELYSFTDKDIAVKALAENRADIFLAGDDFDIDFGKIPSKCTFAYFVAATGIDSFNDKSAICKYQKADLIYKQMLSLYSEKAGGISSLKLDDDSTRVFIFSSPCGGVGTSTVAAACAKHFALTGASVLYLDLETFGAADIFFTGEGQFDMNEVIYALKSKKTNLSMKLESCVKKDASGVCFFSASKVPLDMMEMKNDDILRLIDELKITGSYNYIIVDIGFGLDGDHLKIYRNAHSVVWISDGEPTSNNKITRAYAAAALLEQTKNVEILNRLNLMYNRFSSKSGQYAEGVDIKVLGGTQVFVHTNPVQVVDQIAGMPIFDHIV